MSSYMRGYEYWAEESADERRALYEDLKTREDNPYSVDLRRNLKRHGKPRSMTGIKNRH